MSHTIITHVLTDGELPSVGMKKQVTPICSTFHDVEQGFYFIGYNGSQRLREDNLKTSGTLYAVPEHPLVPGIMTIWIDHHTAYYQDGGAWIPIGKIEKVIN